MSDIDGFASSLLEEAKRFLELAIESNNKIAMDAFLHASLMLSFCALDAHVNSVADEMSTRIGLSLHEKAVLLEKDVKLENGQFKLRNELKMFRIEDRLSFLYAKFSTSPLDKKSEWWGNLKIATNLRNQLTHPKNAANISIDDVKLAIVAIVETIQALYKAIYRKDFPAHSRGTHSKLIF